MGAEVINLTCPGCGARVSTKDQECEYCHKPITISSFNSMKGLQFAELNKYKNTYDTVLKDNPDNPEINYSIAMCYLKLKLYDKAIESFDKVINQNIDATDAYYYAAICFLKGTKAFTQTRETIDKVLQYLDAAISIEPKGMYYYYEAYIKYDYFKRKFLKTTPTYEELLENAKQVGINDAEIVEFYEILGVERPNVL